MAARAPFARAAEGVRLPDGNPNTTVTFAVTRKLAVSSDSNGNLDVVVLPNLESFLFSTRGVCGDVSLYAAATGTTVDTVYAPTTTTTTAARFDTTTLSGMYNRFRIVAYGVRLRVSSGVETNGEFTIATMPLKGLVNPAGSLRPAVIGADGFTNEMMSYYGKAGPRSTVGQMLDSLGLPYTGTDNAAQVDISKLVNIPAHATVTASEASARGVHVRGLPFESAAREYRAMAFKAHGTDCMDVIFSTGTSGNAGSAVTAFQLGTDMSPYKIGGHESCIIGGSGFTASASVGTVEVIYHVEAIPNPQYAALARPTGQVPIVPPSQTLDSVLTLLHKLPRISFADAVTQVGDALLGDIEGRAQGAAAAGLGSLAGTLARLTMAAV